MRVTTVLACALLLSACSRLSPSAIPESGSASVRPAAAWLCGQTPSAEGVRYAGGVEPDGGSSYKILYRFKAGNDGGYPYDGLTLVNGKLYGTTDQGGTAGYGTVFEVSTVGSEKVIYSFKGGKDGAYPCSGLLDVGGKLYGTTQSGGTPNWGTIFEVTTSGQERVVYAFKAGNDGAAPYGGLYFTSGKLYGTTVEGGTKGWGTFFETTTSGPAHVLYSFKAGSDGGYPYGTLLSVNGTLYGTTQSGGTPSGWGTVFNMSIAGKERVLYRFKAGKDGGNPFDGLTNLNGKLYGMTKYGGSGGYGTVFSVTTSGQEHIVYSFKGGSDGAYPYSRLLANNGALYGTTQSGGTPSGWGTVFRVDTSGKETVLYRFKAGTDGANPFARLLALNGRLYGTTQGGGTNGGWGTIFSLSP
jgi:uncharacterized repeat protein (TIGR03803 family)